MPGDCGPPRLVIEPLDTAKHDRAGFSCGIARLDNFLDRTARRQQAADFTRIRVATEDGKGAVLGYYALIAHALEANDDRPPEMARHAPRSGSILAVYLSMIAVDERHQGRGMGRILLADRRRVRCAAGFFSSGVVTTMWSYAGMRRQTTSSKRPSNVMSASASTKRGTAIGCSVAFDPPAGLNAVPR